MGFIVFFVIAFLVSVALYVGGKLAIGASSGEDVSYDDKNILRNGGIAAKIIGAGIAAIMLLIALPANALHIVPAGNVGVIYTFGDITGQSGEGLVVTWPWQEVKRANVQVQTLAFVDEAETVPEGGRHIGAGLDSFSTETQNVYIDAILRIKVSSDDVQGLYRNVGSNYVNKLIPGSIAQVFKDETVNYNAVDIAPSRETIRANVEIAIKAELNRFSIDVDALLIENIHFAPEFEDAIQAKQNASQEALKQEELVRAKVAEAEQAVAIATGEAEANRVLAESLATQGNYILQFRAIEKLADDIKIILMDSDNGLIPVLSGDLLSGTSPAPDPVDENR